jgi:hypothetical protein
MTYELSLAELESELSAELPARDLMHFYRRRKYGSGGASAGASFGSVANANHTQQSNINPQTLVNTGNVNGNIFVTSNNRNTNSNTQFGTPVNFSVGGY